MYYQIPLRIRSAKRFLNKEWLEHTVYEFGDKARMASLADRTVCPDDTLPLHCVANAVAVLCGDRPIPSKRAHSPFADYPGFRRYVDIARRAHVRIDSIPNNTSTMQTAKASMYNLGTDGGISCKQSKTTAKLNIDGKDFDLKRGCPTHESIGFAWPRDIYLSFDRLCKEVIGADYKKDLNVLQTLSILRKKYNQKCKQVINFFNDLTQSKQVTVIERDLIDPVVRGEVSGSIFRGETWGRSCELKSWAAPIAIHGSPQMCWVINGMLYLKVTEKELESILKGPESATILDGGILSPVDSDGNETFGGLREVITRWDKANDSLPTPFE